MEYIITKIFAYLFLVLEIICFVGFFKGHTHQIVGVIICGSMAFVLFFEASQYKKKIKQQN